MPLFTRTTLNQLLSFMQQYIPVDTGLYCCIGDISQCVKTNQRHGLHCCHGDA